MTKTRKDRLRAMRLQRIRWEGSLSTWNDLVDEHSESALECFLDSMIAPCDILNHLARREKRAVLALEAIDVRAERHGVQKGDEKLIGQLTKRISRVRTMALAIKDPDGYAKLMAYRGDQDALARSEEAGDLIHAVANTSTKDLMTLWGDMGGPKP